MTIEKLIRYEHIEEHNAGVVVDADEESLSTACSSYKMTRFYKEMGGIG